MVAYWVARAKVNNPDQYKKYAELVPGILPKFGGRFLARGGTITPLEGDWNPQRMVVLEFDNVEQARAWYDSPAYAPLREHRRAHNRFDMSLVDGLADNETLLGLLRDEDGRGQADASAGTSA